VFLASYFKELRIGQGKPFENGIHVEAPLAWAEFAGPAVGRHFARADQFVEAGHAHPQHSCGLERSQEKIIGFLRFLDGFHDRRSLQ